jgi:toxin-antitoxin system PIN domain toxin
VILVDANILVYAYVSDFEQHGKSREWLESEIADRTRVALPWESLLAFARLVTNPRLSSKPVSIKEAWSQVRAWLRAPSVWTPLPSPDHGDLLGQFLSEPGLRHIDIPDAHLAALAKEHGLRLASHDRGFARFEGIDWFDPIA